MIGDAGLTGLLETSEDSKRRIPVRLFFCLKITRQKYHEVFWPSYDVDERHRSAICESPKRQYYCPFLKLYEHRIFGKLD